MRRAYCAAGRKEVAEWVLAFAAPDVTEVTEHWIMEGRTDVIVVNEVEAPLWGILPPFQIDVPDLRHERLLRQSYMTGLAVHKPWSMILNSGI